MDMLVNFAVAVVLAFAFCAAAYGIISVIEPRTSRLSAPAELTILFLLAVAMAGVSLLLIVNVEPLLRPLA